MAHNLGYGPVTQKRAKLIWTRTTTFWAALGTLVAILAAGWFGNAALADILEGPTLVRRLAERVGMLEKKQTHQEIEQRLRDEHIEHEIIQVREDLRWVQTGRLLPPVEKHELPTPSPTPVGTPEP